MMLITNNMPIKLQIDIFFGWAAFGSVFSINKATFFERLFGYFVVWYIKRIYLEYWDKTAQDRYIFLKKMCSCTSKFSLLTWFWFGFGWNVTMSATVQFCVRNNPQNVFTRARAVFSSSDLIWTDLDLDSRLACVPCPNGSFTSLQNHSEIGFAVVFTLFLADDKAKGVSFDLWPDVDPTF